jgi:hypothetical protein
MGPEYSYFLKTIVVMRETEKELYEEFTRGEWKLRIEKGLLYVIKENSHSSVSSSLVTKTLSENNLLALSQMLHPKVLSYITQNNLFQKYDPNN